MTQDDGDGVSRALSPAHSERPDYVGRYRIEAPLGRGGMGSVHRAFDSARGRSVALKRFALPDELQRTAAADTTWSSSTAAGDRRKRTRLRVQLIRLFQREYQMLAQLAHPSIVEVYDYGVFEGAPFYTMELLDGSDLGKLGRLPWRRVCALLRDVASALTLLHARRLLHRDLSPRNVHCTRDGRAKLLDFGAMAAMGPSGLLVGTPAYVAPEVLQQLPLDARADLYALGALGYTLLTGRAPYLAQHFADLDDAYRSAPLPPSSYDPELPEALDALIMQLIARERAERPGSAIELVERLSVLAGFEHDARLAVASVYLSTPTLIGRKSELVAARSCALRTLRGRGASLLVEGSRGVGRTRFLDACALEGKLAGMLVLRGAARSTAGQELSLVRSLLLQLHAELAQHERRRFVPPEPVASALLPSLVWAQAGGEPSDATQPPSAADSAELARLLQDYLLGLASERPLLILVDDFEQADPHSTAVVAGLARAAALGRLMIVLSFELGAGQAHGEAALRVLRSYSRTLTLRPLDAEQIAALLRSAFGDVPNLPLVADRLHALCAGKPSLCLELARHLVDTGAIRYESGGFVLPPDTSAELPLNLQQVLRARFARLSRGARELGATLALCDGAPLNVGQCLEIAASSDPEQAQRELSELIATDTITLHREHVSLRQSAFGPSLLEGIAPELRRQLHARAAALLSEVPALRVRAAQHYLRAGLTAAALDLLVAVAPALLDDWVPGFEALSGEALAACEALGRPARDAYVLRRARVRHRITFVEQGDRAELLAFAAELEELSGLAYYRQLDPRLTAAERLTRALGHASQAYRAKPEHARTCDPVEALTELTTYCAALAGYATTTFDNELLSCVPSLEPFVTLSPAIALTERLCAGFRELRAGRSDCYRQTLAELLARLDEPDHCGLPEPTYQRVRCGLLYSMALSDAALGRAGALQRASELECFAPMRCNAWRIRHITYLYRGDPHHADACRRELELLLLHEHGGQMYRGSTLEVEFMCYARTDDLLGLRRILPELERMAARFPGCRPAYLLAQGELERLRGRHELALSFHEQALAITRAGAHTLWAYAAAFRVQALVALGRLDEALRFGHEALTAVRALRLEFVGCTLIGTVAHAEASHGNHAAAFALLEQVVALLDLHAVSGLFGGIWHEQLARLALQTGDHARFTRHLQRCAQNFGNALDSPFAVRLARLRADAQLLLEPELPRGSVVDPAALRARRELRACPDFDSRAQRALGLLLELTSARSGHLFGVQAGALQLLASRAARGSAEALLGELARRVRAGELAGMDETPDGGIISLVRDDSGSPHTTFTLTLELSRRRRAVAVAALSGMLPPCDERAAGLLRVISEELFAGAHAGAVTLPRS